MPDAVCDVWSKPVRERERSADKEDTEKWRHANVAHEPEPANTLKCFGNHLRLCSCSFQGLTLEVSGRCHSERQITVARRSGPLDRIVSCHA